MQALAESRRMVRLPKTLLENPISTDESSANVLCTSLYEALLGDVLFFMVATI